jgi:regulation of enolase protein 1 (concanavalin A-like superfamily)
VQQLESRIAPSVVYSIQGSNWPADRRAAAVAAMDAAVGRYNDYGGFDKTVNVYYDPGVPTSDGNYNGTIRFGGTWPNDGVAQHELAHTLGVGTAPQWGSFSFGGTWHGAYAIEQLHLFDGPGAVLSSDNMHFWPYGLNYPNEYTDTGKLRNVAMVHALRADMGIGPAFPSDWASTQIGNPRLPDSGIFLQDSGIWTVSGNGADIAGTADQFHFVAQYFPGDGSLTARVLSLQNTDPWAKAGVMFRDSTNPSAVFADVMATPGNGVIFQWRDTPGGPTDKSQVTGLHAPVWVQVVRAGNAFSGYYSTDGNTWVQIGSTHTVVMSPAARAGLAVCSHNVSALTSADFSNVSVLPASWNDGDVGAPGSPGSSLFDPTAGTWAVGGSGADIWNASDQFHFLYQPFSGDGEITARVTAVGNTGPFAKAGVMLRESLAANSRHALVDVTPSHGVEFIRRTATGANAVSNFDPGVAAPYWARLVRRGTTFTAHDSSDGLTWHPVGSVDIPMGDTVYAGLAVCAFNNAAVNAATFSNVSVLSSGWTAGDIGGPGRPGSSFYDPAAGTWTVAGGGVDIWNTSDQFRFVSQGFTGDGSLIAKVNGAPNTDPWAKAGVMFRDSADASAVFADVMATPGNGVTFQWRDTYGVVPHFINVTGLHAPVWVQLVRAGDAFSASYSTDGVTWVQLGTTQTVVINPTALVGLAVTSHNNGIVNTSTFDNLSIVAPADLSGAFDLSGMYTDGTAFAGGLDGNGDAYSASLLGPALSANGYDFNLGAAGGANAVQAAGQTISLPAGQFSVLSFLGTGVNGPQPGQAFVVTYTDGTSDTFTVDLSDWLSPQGYGGESVAAALGYYDAADGSSPAVTNYLYQYSLVLNNHKTVSGITLPNNGNVLVLAIDLRA